LDAAAGPFFSDEHTLHPRYANYAGGGRLLSLMSGFSHFGPVLRSDGLYGADKPNVASFYIDVGSITPAPRKHPSSWGRACRRHRSSAAHAPEALPYGPFGAKQALN
jgi:hypothetical protein